MKCKYRSCIIQKIIRAFDSRKQYLPFLYLKLRKCSLFLAVSETSIINDFRKTAFKESMLDEDDGPFSAIKSSIDQLQQRNENLVSYDFLYKDMLTVDHNIAVMREVMTDEELARGIIEVADEELQEEDNEDTDGTLTKPMTEEICKAIDTLFVCLLGVAKLER